MKNKTSTLKEEAIHIEGGPSGMETNIYVKGKKLNLVQRAIVAMYPDKLNEVEIRLPVGLDVTGAKEELKIALEVIDREVAIQQLEELLAELRPVLIVPKPEKSKMTISVSKIAERAHLAWSVLRFGTIDMETHIIYHYQTENKLKEALDSLYYSVSMSSVSGAFLREKIEQYCVEKKIKDGPGICQHCGYPTRIRNPAKEAKTGDCDHLHYPENCPECQKLRKKEERA